jgi:FMN phosphatase YigB (HAD superfamily)
MRIVLFDLGNTLVDDNDAPLPGAVDMLKAVSALRDPEGEPVALALVSDYHDANTPAEVEARRREYLAIVEAAGLAPFFKPASQRVTLSTEVGVGKPDERIFRAAVDKIRRGEGFHHVLFVTENPDHIRGARDLGMMAVHFKGPGQASGEVEHLADLVPLVRRLVLFSPCCKKRGEAVGLHASPANRSKRQDPQVGDLTKKVDPDRLARSIAALADFGTRYAYSPQVRRVPEWVRDQFVQAGYPGGGEVRFQNFTLPGAGGGAGGGGPQRNVLCGPVAAGHAGFVLVCAHYDSLSETPASRAPGADDNATGVAVMLEAARLLHGVPLRRGVLFAAFGGEEQGLFGSAACADVAKAERWRIDCVLNLDMVGYEEPQRRGHVIVEYDQGNREPGNDPAAKAFGLLMAQAAADYTSLTVEHSDIWNSDYIPFEQLGYPCIGVYEAGQNPAYHRSTDTADKLDMRHLAEVTKMVLATVLLIAR